MNCQRSTISEQVARSGRPASDTDYAFVALGANLDSLHGAPVQSIKTAFSMLAGLSDEPLLVSSLWRSAPEDCPPGSPDFVNAIAALIPRPGQTPYQLLQDLQDIEQAFGRPALSERQHNAPRPLDLDIIDFCGQRIVDDILTLPHPRARERLFVLAPLAEIAPDHYLPGIDLSVFELKRRIPAVEGFTRIA